MKGLKFLPLSISTAVAICCCASGCGSSGREKSSTDSIGDIGRLPDTLKVATLYSPTSYFIYREEKMGYDYTLVMRLAADKGMVVDLVVAPNLNAMIEMLDTGSIDLIAYEVPVIAEYRAKALACGPENFTSQVLVQPRGDSLAIKDVTELVGRDVYVEKDSKYLLRLQNLNDELGGGIKIHPIDRDTLITEDLIEMVSSGEIPLTVVDSDIARINKTYYRNLDITLKLSFPQQSSWAVSPKNQWLADSIDQWFDQENHRRTQAELLKRYFELSKNETSTPTIDLSRGYISPYDKLFRQYAKTIGIDWRLLASQGYAESHFDTTVVSWAGARGIMQIMPGTARAYGLTAEQITNPEANISTAARIIADLNKSLSRYVDNPEERLKFVVAAYNSGLAHIYDAIALAKKYGKNPTVWSGNVEEALLMKSKPEYYNDEVCKYGYFRGRQTREYVIKVMDFYTKARRQIPA